MKTKAYIGNCPNCGRECMSGLKTTSCWHCETEFTIPTDMQEISYVNSTSIESKGCDNEQEPCEDAISRQAVLDQTYLWSKDEFLRVTNPFDYLRKRINSLSPVTPKTKTGHCRECKWWKDSDGEYRRGSEAESPCPINRIEVFEGNGYCYMFEPQESESKRYMELAKSYVQGLCDGLAESEVEK